MASRYPAQESAAVLSTNSLHAGAAPVHGTAESLGRFITYHLPFVRSGVQLWNLLRRCSESSWLVASCVLDASGNLGFKLSHRAPRRQPGVTGGRRQVTRNDSASRKQHYQDEG